MGKKVEKINRNLYLGFFFPLNLDNEGIFADCGAASQQMNTGVQKTYSDTLVFQRTHIK